MTSLSNQSNNAVKCLKEIRRGFQKYFFWMQRPAIMTVERAFLAAVLHWQCEQTCRATGTRIHSHVMPAFRRRQEANNDRRSGEPAPEYDAHAYLVARWQAICPYQSG